MRQNEGRDKMKSLGAIFGLLGLLIVAFLIGWWAVKSFQPAESGQEAANQTEAIAAAKALYIQQKSAGVDFSNGPCLSEEVIPGWAVDIAHSPRQGVDDFSQNQCASYSSGKVKHFVELDLDGNLIRAE